MIKPTSHSTDPQPPHLALLGLKITAAAWQPADSAEVDVPAVNKMADNENFDSRRSSFVDDNVRFGSRRQSHNLYRHASNISQ